MEAMNVGIICNYEDVTTLEPFQVKNLLWGTKEIPKTYGYLGFVLGDGFCLKLVCEEENPLRIYTKNNAPVYKDSAMEAFFQFESKQWNARFPYLNFEVNANGALLAGYGEKRTYRTYFSSEEQEQFCCKAKIEEKKWSVDLRIPIQMLERIYGALSFEVGSTFTCNFYKISETEDIEHYAAWSPINADAPSFHLPEYFGRAVIADTNK